MDYEAIRLANIKRNQEMLASLRLKKPEREKSSQNSQKSSRDSQTTNKPIVTRKSERLSNVTVNSRNIEVILSSRPIPSHEPQKRISRISKRRKVESESEESSEEEYEADFLDEEDDTDSPIITKVTRKTPITVNTSFAYDFVEEVSTVENPVIMMTGIDSGMYAEKIVELGGSVEFSTCLNHVTHLVSDRFTRTAKFLSSICFPVPFIVSTKWLDSSIQKGYFVEESMYPIVDTNSEQQLGFKLKESHAKAQRKRVFEGFLFFLTPNIQPEPLLLSQVIRCGGGKVLLEMPKTYDSTILIITCNEDLDFLNEHVLKFKKTNACLVEFIVMGAVRQFLDFTQYKFKF